MRKETRFWHYSPVLKKSTAKMYAFTAGLGLITALPLLVMFTGKNFLLLADEQMWKQFFFALAGFAGSLIACVLLFGWPMLQALRKRIIVTAGPNQVLVGEHTYVHGGGARIVYQIGRSPSTSRSVGHTIATLMIESPKRWKTIAVVAGDQMKVLADFAARLSAASGLPLVEKKTS